MKELQAISYLCQWIRNFKARVSVDVTPLNWLPLDYLHGSTLMVYRRFVTLKDNILIYFSTHILYQCLTSNWSHGCYNILGDQCLTSNWSHGCYNILGDVILRTL